MAALLNRLDRKNLRNYLTFTVWLIFGWMTLFFLGSLYAFVGTLLNIVSLLNELPDLKLGVFSMLLVFAFASFVFFHYLKNSYLELRSRKKGNITS